MWRMNVFALKIILFLFCNVDLVVLFSSYVGCLEFANKTSYLQYIIIYRI